VKALSIVAFLMRSVQSENGHSALPFFFWKVAILLLEKGAAGETH